MDTSLTGPPPCGVCNGPIHDRFLLRVKDDVYHEDCLQCSACGTPLTISCFARDSKLFCRKDYERLYGKKCMSCAERISSDELVMKVSGNVFHLRCFSCVCCGLRLQTGDQCILRQGQLFCRPDYEKEVEMFQGFAAGLAGASAPKADCLRTFSQLEGDLVFDELSQSGRPHDGRRGPKRPRTILTTQQRRAFKSSFEISPKPCRKVREALAKETGLSVRIVQVWFQNQRAKIKKIQKKARQDNKGSDKEGEDEKPARSKVKEEEQSPIDSNRFLDSGSDNETACEFSSYMKSSPKDVGKTLIKDEMDSQDSSKQNADSLYGSYQESSQNPKLYPPFFNFGFGAAMEQGATGLLLGNGTINPIDRLYSMHSSYFRADDHIIM